MQESSYLISAYYQFTKLDNPHAEVQQHKEFFKNRDVTCRIYISEEGINGQMSAAREDATAYMHWMQERPEFASMPFKVHPHHENVFPKATVKYRKQLVALDASADLSQRGEHLAPQAWKEMLEKEENRILLDVRNDYEWQIGHFKGAELPACDTFRQFRKYADQLKESVDPKKTPVMMYCTGGIRCELYSAVLKEKGFEKVYQLEGGIINYGLKEGNSHWLGKLFVFDDRLAVPLAVGNEVIGNCHLCSQPNDTYYNCANMERNALFLCCPACLKAHVGCCSQQCMHSDKLRPYQPSHKPFRKKSHYKNLQTE